jgi:hypothetical protein
MGCSSLVSLFHEDIAFIVGKPAHLNYTILGDFSKKEGLSFDNPFSLEFFLLSLNQVMVKKSNDHLTRA